MSKLSKSQINKIAAMWASGILLSCDTSSFNCEFSQDDEVIKTVHEIAALIRAELPYLTSLPEIIEYVTLQK